MPGIVETLEELAAQKWSVANPYPAILAYVKSGDPKDLAKIPKTKELVGWWNLGFEGQPDLSPELARLLSVLIERRWYSILGCWLRCWVNKDRMDAERFGAAVAQLQKLGIPAIDLVLQVAENCALHAPEGPTPAGSFILKANAEETIALAKVYSGRFDDCGFTPLTLFLKYNPAALSKALEQILKDKEGAKVRVENWILAAGTLKPAGFELAAAALEQLPEHCRLELAAELAKIQPDRFKPVAEKYARRQLLEEDKAAQISLWMQARDAGLWLAENCGATAIGDLTKYFAAPLDKDPWRKQNQSEFKNAVLDCAVAKLKREALPLIEACFATEQADVQLNALKHRIALAQSADTPVIAETCKKMLAAGEASVVARAVRVIADWNLENVENEIWPLLAHKSRPVRDAAAVALAKLGDSRIGKAQELWKAKRADARIAAVSWLRNVGTEKAIAALRDHLENETDEDVRDALLLALEKLTGAGEAIEPAELKRRVRKTVEKLDGSPVPWLNVKKLPTAKLRNGENLTGDALLYLLYRQSRVKEMRSDIEAKPLYAMIDRKTSGELAAAVLEAFCGSKMDADDRWSLAFAALVGDDRLVPMLSRQIKAWADASRGKLAEYAVQALALLGTDAALLAVDAMAIRYRAKNKNIGKAATEAFVEAARARGLTVEELGDVVVPWLGFVPNQPRIVEAGKSKIEVRISGDFKFVFRDAETKKKVAKLPDSASAATKAEFKNLSANLKEAVKSQLLRMETLMVRQFRWPVRAWAELYLVHPLLAPFTQRLVWGAYDKSGTLTTTFRALEDQTLTDANDDVVCIPKEGFVGAIHPLELSAETRQAWVKHFADYDVVPPFAQLERPVITVQDKEKGILFGTHVNGTDLNAMTFKGRAERLGWARGSVCDGGGINFYYKSFPGAGADVFVEVDGMYVGIDMYSDIKLGKVFFVKHGSVQMGSYTYDEPANESDPRLLSFGSVPVIAFSEAMGDLAKISGKTSTQEQTTE